jgi:microcystin-dependent protein
VLAETGGVEEITLTVNQIPAHSHPLLASTTTAQNANPAGNVLGNQTLAQMYVEDVTSTNLTPNAVASVGGSQPHTNFQPYLCVDFIISLFGIFPSQT